MTVKKLIEKLQEFDEDMKVVIGMEQRYGSNWMMEIADVDELETEPFDNNNDSRIVLTEGRQIGVVCYEER